MGGSELYRPHMDGSVLDGPPMGGTELDIVGLFTVYFIFLQKDLYNKSSLLIYNICICYSILIIYIYISQNLTSHNLSQTVTM